MTRIEEAQAWADSLRDGWFTLDAPSWNGLVYRAIVRWQDDAIGGARWQWCDRDTKLMALAFAATCPKEFR